MLPYAFGTHSGWVEACYDLGTAVLAPRTGHWVEQQPCHEFRWPAGELPDGEDIRAGVTSAYASRCAPAASRSAREEQRNLLATEHERIYRDALHEAGRR